MAAVLAGCMACHQAFACDSRSLDAFEGQWFGRGQITDPEQNDEEPIACRLVFERSAPDRIDTTGKCATVAKTLPVSGHLICEGGAFTGPLLQLREGPDPVFVRDASENGAVRLVLDGVNPNTGKPVRYWLSVNFDGSDRMTMSILRLGVAVLNISYGRETP